VGIPLVGEDGEVEVQRRGNDCVVEPESVHHLILGIGSVDVVPLYLSTQVPEQLVFRVAGLGDVHVLLGRRVEHL